MDRIRHVRLSSVVLPLSSPISDAKVLTGRQRPMTEIAFLFAEIAHRGRPGGHRLQLLQAGRRSRRSTRTPARSRRELIGEDPHDIAPAVDRSWSGRARRSAAAGVADAGDRRVRHRAVGPEGQARGAAAGQAARRAPRLGALLQHLRRVPARADRGGQGARLGVAGRGIGGIKIKVGQPDTRVGPGPGPGGARAPRRRRAADGRRQPAVGPADRAAGRAGRWRSSTWSGSRSRSTPTTREGTPQLAAALDTPIATGEMLTSVGRARRADRARRRGHHPARRARGSAASRRSCGWRRWPSTTGLQLAPHFAMEIHLHLAAAYPREPWVEHFEWLEPLFNERLETRRPDAGARPARPRLHAQRPGAAWTVDTCEFGTR